MLVLLVLVLVGQRERRLQKTHGARAGTRPRSATSSASPCEATGEPCELERVRELVVADKQGYLRIDEASPSADGARRARILGRTANAELQ